MPARGDVYFADLGPTTGSVQRGTRPVVIVQDDVLNQSSLPTVIGIPFTTQTSRATAATNVLVPAGEGGLSEDSVALCHQIRVLDRRQLRTHLGTLSPETMAVIDQRLLNVLSL